MPVGFAFAGCGSPRTQGDGSWSDAGINWDVERMMPVVDVDLMLDSDASLPGFLGPVMST